MPRVYVGVGSNLGRRVQNIERGLRLLEARGFRRIRRSPVYETEPVGMSGARRFLNLVVAAETSETPQSCLERMLDVERILGRTRHSRNTPRTLDLDLLLYGRRKVDCPGLTVPHPRLAERAFVLAPLCDLAPGFIHPVLRVRLSTLLAGIPTRGIRRWERN